MIQAKDIRVPNEYTIPELKAFIAGVEYAEMFYKQVQFEEINNTKEENN